MGSITRERVFQAADDLRSRGLKPTRERIRAELGNVGSYTTIQPFLNEWKASRDSPTRLERQALPPDVQRDAERLLELLWSSMFQKFEDQKMDLLKRCKALEEENRILKVKNADLKILGIQNQELRTKEKKS